MVSILMKIAKSMSSEQIIKGDWDRNRRNCIFSILGRKSRHRGGLLFLFLGAGNLTGRIGESVFMKDKIKVLMICHGKIWGRDDKCRI